MEATKVTKQTDDIQPKGKSKAEYLLDKYKELLGGRSNFESYWQSLHDYFYVEAPNMNKTYYPGTELDFQYLYDSTTLECADVFASGFMNYLTPPTSKWFRLRHKDPRLTENKEIGDFLENVTDEVNYALNRSNFYDQIFPSYKSSGVYGTAALFEEDDSIDDIRFHNMPLKQVIIVEDARGRAVEFFLEFEYTAFQAESRWGREKLSTELQEELRAGKGTDKKHKFLMFIGKRHIREIQKQDKLNMPIESLWIDVEAKTGIEEGGFNEMPAFVHRFDKRPFIPWGFSPAMKGLPFARILQAVSKTNLRAMMKRTDPPKALPHNAFIAPFNSNPRALNYYKKDIMTGGAKDIFTFDNFGDPNAGLAAVEYYQMAVKRIMFHDVFLAFSNITKDMNNPEIMERINEKMTLLGPAVGRAIAEVLHPVVIRTIGILLRKGKLPRVPDSMILNPDFEIDFVGMLAQAQRRSELTTLMTGLSVVGQMAQYAPEALDNIHPDRVTEEVWSITGAPVQVLRDDAEKEQIRKGRAEEAMKMQEMAIAQQGAKAASDAGKAADSFSKAQNNGGKK